MAVRNLKRRIKSLKNISKVTSAMNMISANRLRKAERSAESTRMYRDEMLDLLKNFSSKDFQGEPYFTQKMSNENLNIIIGSDKGLVGSLNSNIRKEINNVGSDEIISIGKKTAKAAKSLKKDLIAQFESSSFEKNDFGVFPIKQLCEEYYLNKGVSNVFLIYTKFVSKAKQMVVKEKLLPINETGTTVQMSKDQSVTYEPNTQEVLHNIIDSYIENSILYAVKQSIVSEHFMRMNAMKSATDNAKDLRKKLEKTYNKSRQNSITSQMQEVAVSAVASKSS